MNGKGQSIEEQFFERLAQPWSLLELFDQLPDVYMYVKDTKSRFVRANRVVCDVVGVNDVEEIRGFDDFKFFPPAIAAQYIAEDRRVIASKTPLYNQVWFVPGCNGLPRLYLCNKIPLLDKQNQVLGIAGMKRPYEPKADSSKGFGRAIDVLVFVTENYGNELEIADLADRAQISVSQLQREFSQLFGITPSRYIKEVRVGVARHLLQSSDLPLSEVALECGFYDQSHFSRSFKSSTGISPLKYRQRFKIGS